VRKPNSDIFVEACKDLDCLPEEVVYVGDTISRDVIGSKNAGLKACVRIFKDGFKEDADEKYKNLDTSYVISDFDELENMIKKIDKI
jgi:putative hydrolase of the HAD superfamily